MDNFNNIITKDTKITKEDKGRRKWIVPAVLIVCIAVVGFWELMANRSRRPFELFRLTAEDFKGFSPVVDGWAIQGVPVGFSPAEPNIVAFRLRKSVDSKVPLSVRLVHGYNMCDCMRIKGYNVEQIEVRSQKSEVSGQTADRSRKTGDSNQTTVISDQYSLLRQGYGGQAGFRSQPSLQIWRVTSGAGDVSIWVTSMLKAGDFSFTDVDVRSMPFPRVGVPDDPGWIPRGLTLASMRHPVQNFRQFLRAKWNNSRCDLMVFLGLKTPAWASNELLTLVSACDLSSGDPGKDELVTSYVVEGHMLMHSCLSSWRADVVTSQKD